MPRQQKNIGIALFKFQSLKKTQTIICRSQLERDFVLHLECSPEVTDYHQSPFKVFFKREGKQRCFEPHFLVRTLKGEEAVWISQKRVDQKNPRLARRLIENVCQQNQIVLTFITKTEIQSQPLLSNFQLLWRYARLEIHPRYLLFCREIFQSKDRLLISDVKAALASQTYPPELVYSLIFRGIIDADLTSTSLTQEDCPLYLNQNHLKMPERRPQ